MKRICLTVTTDLSYDQRMIRICTALAEAGYQVLLIGRKKPNSPPLDQRPYRQKRLPMVFQAGKLMYAEYNFRLLCCLLFVRTDIFCAIDLDTILPNWLASRLRRKQRVFDAHELFCEMKEVVTRPRIYRAWKWLEKRTVPHFKHGYTVNGPIAGEFERMYGVKYAVVRNVPFLRPLDPAMVKQDYIIYQGSVNEGRSFETLVPAMQWVDWPLMICGEGNFMEKLKALVKQYGLEQKILFRGLVKPEALWGLTQEAKIGLTLFENNGLSNYLSLANRFFDYIHAGTPQLCVDYPAYREINNQLAIAVVVEDLSPENIARQLNNLIRNQPLYDQLRQHCLELRQQINWEREKEVLLAFYEQITTAVE